VTDDGAIRRAVLRTLAPMTTTTAFIGGGNMASAIIGGLRRDGRAASSMIVVDPDAAQRERLATTFGVRTAAVPDPALRSATLVVWAVKPQLFQQAAAPARPFVGQALQLSVMAGIRSGAIAAATGTERVVRAMPNTPALIGQGIAGLYARGTIDPAGRQAVESVLAPTGRVLWFEREADLDAVTALSGSGPAYVFFFAEAMVRAAVEMGLTPQQGRELALQTFAGATALALGSGDALELQRERVTSQGGTTHAAITEMQRQRVDAAIVGALKAARDRAIELGDAFG
jgi:pyrroline-5-carboxylate reductase